MRRVKHLRRCCIEERNKRGGGAPLSLVQLRQWSAFVQDKVAKCIVKIPYCQRVAMAQLDTAATELAKAQAAALMVDWRRSFRTFWGASTAARREDREAHCCPSGLLCGGDAE